MMEVGYRAIEQSEMMVAFERDTAVSDIRLMLASPGLEHCADCGEEIGTARRAAMPSARRCGGCQIRHELKERRGW